MRNRRKDRHSEGSFFMHVLLKTDLLLYERYYLKSKSEFTLYNSRPVVVCLTGCCLNRAQSVVVARPLASLHTVLSVRIVVVVVIVDCVTTSHNGFATAAAAARRPGRLVAWRPLSANAICSSQTRALLPFIIFGIDNSSFDRQQWRIFFYLQTFIINNDIFTYIT